VQKVPTARFAPGTPERRILSVEGFRFHCGLDVRGARHVSAKGTPKTGPAQSEMGGSIWTAKAESERFPQEVPEGYEFCLGLNIRAATRATRRRETSL
jgi:hypothetical protein